MLMTLQTPHVYPQRSAPIWVPPKVDGTLAYFLVNYYVILLNSQGKTKIKNDEKPCQILLNTRAIDRILEKLAEVC